MTIDVTERGPSGVLPSAGLPDFKVGDTADAPPTAVPELLGQTAPFDGDPSLSSSDTGNDDDQHNGTGAETTWELSDDDQDPQAARSGIGRTAVAPVQGYSVGSGELPANRRPSHRWRNGSILVILIGGGIAGGTVVANNISRTTQALATQGQEEAATKAAPEEPLPIMPSQVEFGKGLNASIPPDPRFYSDVYSMTPEQLRTRFSIPGSLSPEAAVLLAYINRAAFINAAAGIPDSVVTAPGVSLTKVGQDLLEKTATIYAESTYLDTKSPKAQYEVNRFGEAQAEHVTPYIFAGVIAKSHANQSPIKTGNYSIGYKLLGGADCVVLQAINAVKCTVQVVTLDNYAESNTNGAMRTPQRSTDPVTEQFTLRKTVMPDGRTLWLKLPS